MPDKTIRGRFVWHELLTPNIPHAHNFYTKVIGWKTQPFEHDSGYQMFTASSGPIGGTVHRPEGAASWMPFIGTTDIETTLGDVAQLGGAIVAKPELTPDGNGKWAVLRDPQAAAFAVYQSLTPDAPEKPPKRGEFSWHELATTDYKAAFEFYSMLFGWERADEVEIGPLGMYLTFGRNGAPLGGMFIKPPEMREDPNWCGYIRVRDMNKVVSKAKASGATLVNGPMEVPGGDWIAQLVDPQGALFAVHTLKADAIPADLSAAESEPEQAALDFSIPPQTAQRATATSQRGSASVTSASKKNKAKSVVEARPVLKPAKKSSKRTAAGPSRRRPAKKQLAKKRPAKKKATQRRSTKTPGRKAAKNKASSSKTTARRPK